MSSCLYPNSIPPTTAPYCTDEAILIRAPGDFVALCPPSQRIASGQDGSILVNGWTLASPTVDLSTRGVQPGQVCWVTKPQPPIRAPGETLVAETLSGAALVLRRQGFGVGLGDPIGGPAGLTKVEFAILTLGPQILKASYDMDRRYGVSDLMFGRRHVDLFDPQEVEDVCVLTVLVNQYFALARQTKEDTFAAKAKQAQEQLSDLLRRVEVQWRPLATTQTGSGPFWTRVVRG